MKLIRRRIIFIIFKITLRWFTLVPTEKCNFYVKTKVGIFA